MWQIISTYVIALIMVVGVFIFSKIILRKSIAINKIKFIIILLVVTLFQTLIGIYLENILKTLIITISNVYLVKYTFDISFRKTLFIIFLHMIILIFSDSILYFISKKMENTILYNGFLGDLIRNTISLGCLIGVTKFIKTEIIGIINTGITNNLKLLRYSILTLLSILVIFYSNLSTIIINIDFIIVFFLMSVFAMILFSLIKQIINNDKITKKYDKLLEFMTTYENEIEKQRILRHESTNEFRTIRAKICDKEDREEIIKYIDEIVNDNYKVDKEKYAKFGYLPANGIKGLFYFKTQEADNKGINIAVNISNKIKNSNLYELTIKEQRDFGRILGVFFDNAIEASLSSKEKQLGIEAYVSSEKEAKLIISNTFSNKIDKNKLGKEKYSTKGVKRGHGLLLVKHILSKNDIFKIKTEIYSSIYIQTIEIHKKHN